MRELAIRFCGGCRESYDRTAWLRRLLAGLQAMGCIVTPCYDLNRFPEVGLIVCGCATQCLAQRADFPKQWHSVGPKNFLDNRHTYFNTILLLIATELDCVPKIEMEWRKS